MAMSRQFDAVDRAVNRAATRIAGEIAGLMDKTAEYEDIAPDYVREQLLAVLLLRHPEFLDWLDRSRGEASLRVAEALREWRDLRGQR
jgi:hypothetical protein